MEHKQQVFTQFDFHSVKVSLCLFKVKFPCQHTRAVFPVNTLMVLVMRVLVLETPRLSWRRSRKPAGVNHTNHAGMKNIRLL